jgi:hypothetical protein
MPHRHEVYITKENASEAVITSRKASRLRHTSIFLQLLVALEQVRKGHDDLLRREANVADDGLPLQAATADHAHQVLHAVLRKRSVEVQDLANGTWVTYQSVFQHPANVLHVDHPVRVVAVLRVHADEGRPGPNRVDKRVVLRSRTHTRRSQRSEAAGCTTSRL